MAITTYAELQTAVKGWMHRTDLTSRTLEFITLAETMMNGDIDSREMDVRTTLSTVGGSNIIPLPVDMLEMRRLRLTDDPMRVLKYASPDELTSLYGGYQSARPVSFTVIGAAIELAPVPDNAYPVELVYRQRIPPLTDANTTNWVLTKYPSAYLYGALVAAHPYTKDDARIATFQGLYRQAIDGINGIDWYSGSTLRVRAG